MDLSVLLQPTVDLPRLAEVLDTLGDRARHRAIQKWNRAQLAELFEAAQGFRALSLDAYSPAHVGGDEEAVFDEVIHHGKNSLPMFSLFQKRFCRPKDPEVKDVLWGYNEQVLKSLTGPGYFVMHAGDTEGELDIDYTQLPKDKPKSWPDILPNTARLGRFVYAGMIDVMRGVSDHVSIGRAKRSDGWMDAWFVLCREDPQPEA